MLTRDYLIYIPQFWLYLINILNQKTSEISAYVYLVNALEQPVLSIDIITVKNVIILKYVISYNTVIV